MLIQIYLLFALTILTTRADYGIPKFRTAPFKMRPVSGMYRLGDLNFDNVKNGNQISAYGDFNNDKATDFVSLSDDDRTLTVFVYATNGSFVQYFTKTFSENIIAIIPADYNYDGLLDMMVVTPAGSKASQLSLTIYYGNLGSSRFYPSFNGKFILDTPVLPFVFDAEGDRKVELLYTKGTTRYVISSLDDELYNEVKFEDNYVSKGPECLDYSLVKNNEFANPNSNAFVDFNGDCASDMFLTTKDPEGNLVFEIWYRNLTTSKFCLVDVQKITLPDISLVSIADMDNDGRLDLVYTESPENTSLPMNLHIIYNQFATDPTTPCKLFTTEVDGVYGSPFAAEAYNMKLEDWTADNITITQITAMNSSHMNSSRLFTPNPLRPPKIRLGDINVDGYVDIVMVVYDPENSENADPQYGSVLLGMNNKRGGGMIFNITETSDSSFAPYFQANVNTTASSNNLTALSSFNALAVSFFDFDEKGSLGLWVSIYDEGSEKSSLMGLYNFVSTSNYILKALTLNGNNHELDDVTKKLGGIYHGSSIECIVNDVNGKARIAKATQLGQIGYTALELPYAFIGLGRTNNYVQDFYIGITQNLLDGIDLQKQSWTPIIPNSQLIVNTVIDGDWTLDVYVSPMSQTWLVALITVVILIILAFVIFGLHLKERSEDKKKEERIIVFA